MGLGATRPQPGRAEAPAQDHRITESLRLEKTSKITKSSCHPITTMPAKPCPHHEARARAGSPELFGKEHWGDSGPVPGHQLQEGKRSQRGSSRRAPSDVAREAGLLVKPAGKSGGVGRNTEKHDNINCININFVNIHLSAALGKESERGEKL